MSAITLVLADVDGTLVKQDKTLTQASIDVVRELRANNIRFAITSGRPPRGMAMLVEPLALDTAIAGFNGGVMTRPDLSVIETKTLSPEAARKALATILKGGLDAWVYTPDAWLIRNKDAPHVDREAHTVRFDAVIVDDFTPEQLDHAVKIVGISDDLGAVEACEAAVQAALGGQASAARSQPYYLDVTHPDANKGFVCRMLAQMYGVPKEQVATFGDMPNDVLMFRESAMSVAMGNASEAVRKQATHMTGSNEEDGFAHAVRKHILGG